MENNNRINALLHKLRNAHGQSAGELRAVRLEAADEIERFNSDHPMRCYMNWIEKEQILDQISWVFADFWGAGPNRMQTKQAAEMVLEIVNKHIAIRLEEVGTVEIIQTGPYCKSTQYMVYFKSKRREK